MAKLTGDKAEVQKQLQLIAELQAWFESKGLSPQEAMPVALNFLIRLIGSYSPSEEKALENWFKVMIGSTALVSDAHICNNETKPHTVN